MVKMTSRSVRKVILDTIPGWKRLTGRLSVHYSDLVGYIRVELMTGLLTNEVDVIFNSHGTLKYTDDNGKSNLPKLKSAIQSQFGITLSNGSLSAISRGESVSFKIKNYHI